MSVFLLAFPCCQYCETLTQSPEPFLGEEEEPSHLRLHSYYFGGTDTWYLSILVYSMSTSLETMLQKGHNETWSQWDSLDKEQQGELLLLVVFVVVGTLGLKGNGNMWRVYSFHLIEDRQDCPRTYIWICPAHDDETDSVMTSGPSVWVENASYMCTFLNWISICEHLLCARCCGCHRLSPCPLGA